MLSIPKLGMAKLGFLMGFLKNKTLGSGGPTEDVIKLITFQGHVMGLHNLHKFGKFQTLPAEQRFNNSIGTGT